jgi:hypothetical protein
VDALISEGLLKVGQTLTGQGRFSDVHATVLPDGSLQVGDKIFESPSGAGRAVRKRSTNGWMFWQVDLANGIRLDDLRASTPSSSGWRSRSTTTTTSREWRRSRVKAPRVW